MLPTNLRFHQWKLYQSFAGICFVIGTLLLAKSPILLAQNSPGASRTVRTLYPSDWEMYGNIGMTYSGSLNQFFLLKQDSLDASATPRFSIIGLTPFEKEVDRLDLNLPLDNVENIIFDDATMSLYLVENNPAEMVRISLGADRKLDASSLTRFDLARAGINPVQGVAIDAQSSTLYLLERQTSQLISIHLSAEGPDLSSLATLNLSEISNSKLSNGTLSGLAMHPITHHLYTVNQDEALLYEFSTIGQKIATYKVDSLELAALHSMSFGFSADLTDPEDTIHLFMLDNHSNNNQAEEEVNDGASNRIFLPIVAAANANAETTSQTDAPSPSRQLGQLIEVELTAQPQFVNVAAIDAISLQLIRTINTAAFAKPSTDPSGLLYYPPSNKLIMTDGEVEETVSGITFFAGANVWEMTLNGTVLRTTNISQKSPTSAAMTNEPTGIAWNPNNGHFYVTDDDAQEVYDLNPGNDGLIGTSDDRWTSFDTAVYGNLDPEGIAYDSVNNRIYVSDGVNAEIYQYTTSGSLVTHFDVQTYGVVDPESVEYNSDSGTLFVLSNVGNRIVIETTLSGSLLQSYDFSATGATAPAGLAYAPASDGSGAQRFYIADRRVDNNSNPNENDGRIYEVSAPQTSSPTGTPVGATSTPTRTPVPQQGTQTPTPASGQASITIIEQAVPQSSQNFTFYSAFGTFQLDNPASDDGDGISSSITYGVSPGAYNVSQATQSGWRLAQISCTPSNKATVNLSQTNVAISVVAGDNVTCTFVNESTTTTPVATANTPTNTPVSATNTPGNTPTSIPSGTCSAGTQTISIRITVRSDDAEQFLSDGLVDPGSSDLELINDGGSKPQIVGLRFPGIAIPRNATITNAIIEFEVDETDSGATSITFRAQAADNAPTFAASTNNISNRPLTSASINWNNIQPWTAVNAKHQTPNLAPVLQEVINRNGWASGNALVFVVSGSGERTAESVDGEPAAAPLLTVQFCNPNGGNSATPTATPTSVPATNTPATTPVGATNTPVNTPVSPTNTPTSLPGGTCSAGVQTISIRITARSDDAEQFLSDGLVDPGSTDLELINDGGSKPQIVGLRFPGIAIPRNATITNAIIEFEVDETDSGATSITFRAQAADNAPTFAASTNNISNRPLTNASINWNNIQPWTAVNAKHQTPNLAPVLQEVINRNGWSAGNALVFVVSGSGERTAESVDGEPAAAPLLSVQFCNP